MRPSLLNPLAERRHARRHRRGRGAAPPAHRALDPAVQRVRDAGGPVDRASYTCQCGCLFEAKVSTSVACPHCGCGQAW
jgi:hypothetical protein